MTHTYNISGMTCEACEYKVKHLLEQIEGVTEAKPNRLSGEVTITMQQHIDTPLLQNALKDYPKYRLTEKAAVISISVSSDSQKSWLQTYKPVLLIFAYITGITLLIQLQSSAFDLMQWMNHFMAGFFITFSFFKMLNLKGFAESYATYDIIGMRWKSYGYLYAGIELLLGICYITGFNPVFTNAFALVIMSISLVGVLQSILNKKKIKCACLGDVFDLPMSTVTVIEDTLMIAMSAMMLIMLS